MGGALLAVGRLHSSAANGLEQPSHAATDAQTKSQVVDQTSLIVSIAGLQKPTASYLLMSCKDRNDPPYQGAIYLNFVLTADADADEYFRTAAAAMVAHGWKEGLPPNRALRGRTFAKDGITAILYQGADFPDQGVGRIYGPCNDMTNHRTDSTGWTDVTEQLR